MSAPDDRSLITAKVDKAAALREAWSRQAAVDPEVTLSCQRELSEALRSAGFSHPGLPRVELTPFFLEANSVRELTRSVRALCAIFEQVNRLALLNVAFLRQLEISPNLEELLRREPESRLSLEFARLDFVPTAGGPRFVEFVLDTPRGAMLGATLQKEFLAHPLSQKAGLSAVQPSSTTPALMADLFLAVWAERGNLEIEQPNVAIIDWRETESRPAQESILAEIRSRGMVAERVDPREFVYRRDERALYRGDTRFDLLYRAATVQDIAVRRLLLSEFLDAVFDETVVLVNPLRARPASVPQALEILTSRDFDGFFSPADNEFKARLLPWTRTLSARHTDFHGRDIDLLTFVAARPERFVIKAGNSMGGSDVALGAFAPREKWLSRIEDGVRQGDIVQEYVENAKHTSDHARGLSTGKNLLLSAYAVRGEYAGCSGYVSDEPVIKPQSAFVIPVFELGGRSKTGPIKAGRPTRKRKPTNTQQN